MMKKVEIEIKGQRMFGAVAVSGGTAWYSLNGEVWTVESEGRSARGGSGRSAGGSADPSQITAPMPGKIIKVMVAKNVGVEAGDVLVVMEAMKMEYTLKASAAGTVQEISCSVGQQVTLGSTLVKLNLSKEN